MTAGAPSTGGRVSHGDGWVVVIPVKPSIVGKSRLGGTRITRAALARAIALDTIAAAASAEPVAEVIVVTDDSDLAAEAREIYGVRVVSEGSSRGLNDAIAVGMREAGIGVRRGALLGDLPALRPDDLSLALDAAASVDRAVVADAEGTGSTLVTVGAGVEWTSAFGEDSFALHIASGCVPLGIPETSTLRRDVDTVAQLDQARVLGVGPRTRRLAIR